MLCDQEAGTVHHNNVLLTGRTVKQFSHICSSVLLYETNQFCYELLVAYIPQWQI